MEKRNSQLIDKQGEKTDEEEKWTKRKIEKWRGKNRQRREIDKVIDRRTDKIKKNIVKKQTQ